MKLLNCYYFHLRLLTFKRTGLLLVLSIFNISTQKKIKLISTRPLDFKALSIAVFIITFLCIPATASAAIYVYITPDGSNLISDKKIKKAGYQLKRSYKTKPYRSGGRKNPYLAKPIKSQYDALIVNLALQYGIEPSFIKSVIHVESAFDNKAISHAGAMGLMQLMPATAASYELTENHFDARKNIEAGVRHMKDLMERYSDDKKLALAAYNAGAGAVRKYNGIPPYKETQNYVVKVMALYSVYKKVI